jgi:hypothetical protein
VLFDGPVCVGGDVYRLEPPGRSVGCARVGRVGDGVGGGDDGSGIVERIWGVVVGEALSDADAVFTACRDGDAAVDAAFDVEGETTPRVPRVAGLRERTKPDGEVRRGWCPGRDGLDSGDPCLAERVVDGVEVALGVGSLSGGEDGSGLAETVEAVGEGSS